MENSNQKDRILIISFFDFIARTAPKKQAAKRPAAAKKAARPAKKAAKPAKKTAAKRPAKKVAAKRTTPKK